MRDGLLIRGGHVVTMDEGRRELAGGWIAVRDGAIAAVGEAGEEPPAERFGRVVEAGGCVVAPGLVNAHQHLWYTLFRGLGEGLALEGWLERLLFRLAPRIGRDELELTTRLGCAEMLATGTTSAFYHLVTRSDAADAAAIARAARECGFRLVVGKELRADDLADDLAAAEEALAALDGGLVSAGLVLETAPHWLARRTTTDRLVRRGHELAHARDLRISDHVATGAESGYRDWVRKTGRTDVEYLERLGVLDDRWLLVHAIWLDDADVGRVARSGATVVATPTSQAARGGGATPVARVLGRGGSAALGTDGPMVDTSVDMVEQAKALAAEQRQLAHDAAALGARAALELATRAAAEAIGLGALAGSLEPGKRADVAVFTLERPHVGVVHDPVVSLVTAARGADAVLVLVDGEPRVVDGGLVGVDYPALLAEAAGRARALVAEPATVVRA